jgi:DNA repair photolyase
MHFVDVKGILSAQNGMNIYRGCTHGCIYCDARSKCYGFTHDFEDIEVKQNAPVLLEQALRSKRKKCMIGTGAMSDPYMHCEEKLQLTRKCLEIGIICFDMGVTLREGDREYFYAALDKHFPGMSERYHSKYGYAYEVSSDRHQELMQIVRKQCEQHGIVCDVDQCFQYLHELPEKYEQMTLF